MPAEPVDDQYSEVTSEVTYSGPQAPKSVIAVGTILDALAKEPEVGVRELARKLDLSIGMVQRVLTGLGEFQLAKLNPATQRYRLDYGVLVLGDAYRQRSGRGIAAMMEGLQALAEETSETACLHRRVGIHRVIVAQFEAPHDLLWKGDPGALYPLYAGAAGKAILAWLSDSELEGFFAQCGFEHLQPGTPANEHQLRLQLEEVRKAGVAVSFSERESGAGGVAAPILNAAGTSEYSVSLYGPEARVRDHLGRVTQAVIDFSKRFSEAPAGRQASP